ncbi:low molecular weight protein arginine phosphatase [Neobacillus sp. PS3-40]|uniref:low molecular weight protein arginine phosphatase n=1 Tax=Neobacillus sp. PS3-40 TaxID=3070679 RepID=UPI0027E1A698|nr:low molecular weight protein arginine phosphatase [Neobacillus sp. PS3-40]WML46250.1 low molecular weight protein arginine phosphatase [Neobacillus sp. PS3-40]
MQRILFVCTGNTCRSPMAEAILINKKSKEIEVQSAGIYAAYGSEAAEYAKTVMDEFKVAHSHKSSPLTETNVNWATVILTMTSSHKATIAQNFPNAAAKIFTLKEFAGEEERDVIDPFGGNLDMYRNTFKELEKLIDKAIEQLENKIE